MINLNGNTRYMLKFYFVRTQEPYMGAAPSWDHHDDSWAPVDGEGQDDDAAEVVVNDGGGDWQVQLQTLMCWVLLCTLLVLVLLIFLSWRKYGRIIMRSRAGASADAKKKER